MAGILCTPATVNQRSVIITLQKCQLKGIQNQSGIICSTHRKGNNLPMLFTRASRILSQIPLPRHRQNRRCTFFQFPLGFYQVSPRRSGAQNPECPVDKLPGVSGVPSSSSLFAYGGWPDFLPYAIAYIMSMLFPRHFSALLSR